MGFLGKVVAFERAVVGGDQAPEALIDRDGDEVATATCFGPPGDDSPPMPGDVVACNEGSGAGTADAVGYQDPLTPGLAIAGERRLYSRSAPGVVAVELWLKGDGSLVARTPLGAELVLGPDGSARIGNALGELAIDAAGVVTWRTPLGQNAAGTHTHPTPFGPSGPPIVIPGTGPSDPPTEEP